MIPEWKDLKQLAGEVADMLEKGEIPPPSKEQIVLTFRKLHDVLELMAQVEGERDELLDAGNELLQSLEYVERIHGREISGGFKREQDINRWKKITTAEQKP